MSPNKKPEQKLTLTFAVIFHHTASFLHHIPLINCNWISSCGPWSSPDVWSTVDIGYGIWCQRIMYHPHFITLLKYKVSFGYCPWHLRWAQVFCFIALKGSWWVGVKGWTHVLFIYEQSINHQYFFLNVFVVLSKETKIIPFPSSINVTSIMFDI